MSQVTMARPEASATPTIQPRIRLHHLDGLRGLAALYVVFNHTWLASRANFAGQAAPSWFKLTSIFYPGHFAVDVFIVLSGYCLMLPVLKTAQGTIQNGFGYYIARRAKRILPPYYAALLLTLALMALVPGLRQHTGAGDSHTAWQAEAMPGAILSHLFLLHNLNPNWIFRISSPLWSVATEWQIYFLFPALLLPLWRRFGTAVTVAVGFAVGAATLALHWQDACFWYLGLFALGMGGAAVNFPPRLSPANVKTENNNRWLGYGLLLLAALFTLAMMKHYHIMRPAFDLVVGVATMLLLVHCANSAREPEARRHSLLLRLLSAPAVVALGGFSYSLYLTHAPLVACFGLLVAHRGLSPTLLFALYMLVVPPIVVALAYGFHRLFERRFMNTPPVPVKS